MRVKYRNGLRFSITALLAAFIWSGLAQGQPSSCQGKRLDPSLLTASCQVEVAAERDTIHVYLGRLDGTCIFTGWTDPSEPDICLSDRIYQNPPDHNISESCWAEIEATSVWVTVTDDGDPCVITPCTDTDGDGICNVIDNCSELANLTQTDTNSDGFGNACDADWDNNGIVGATDLGLFQTHLFHPAGTDPMDAEIDCQEPPNGMVGVQDMGCWMVGFSGPPGPSGRWCADPTAPGTCP